MRGVRAPKGWKRKFLRFLSQYPNVSEACRLSGITPPTAYSLREKDPKFKDSWEVALTFAKGRMLQTMFEVGRNGTKRGVWMKDKDGNPLKVETVREYSPQMMMFLARAWFKEFQEKSTVALVGALDAPPIQNQHSVSQDLLDQLAELQAKKEGNGNGAT